MKLEDVIPYCCSGFFVYVGDWCTTDSYCVEQNEIADFLNCSVEYLDATEDCDGCGVVVIGISL